MNVITTKQQFVLLALFALLMAATRFHHFGSALFLPDASLAVFFLAGFYLSGVMALAVLLLEAGLIDYLAITMGGVSDWCVTPAYWFLIPTYACLWCGGRWYAGRRRRVWSTLLPLIGTLLFSVSLAFSFPTPVSICSPATFRRWVGRNTARAWHRIIRDTRPTPSYMWPLPLWRTGPSRCCAR